MEKFKTILEKNTTTEIIEKKSRFIANLFYVETPQEAENKIKQIKKKYYDAKHNCFAYITLNENEIQKKCSDDGEPSGTAGAPMLEILEKQSIYNVVVIVTRYFGGILLGTGGLVRAYSDSLKEAIKKSTLVEQEPGYEAEIKFLEKTKITTEELIRYFYLKDRREEFLKRAIIDFNKTLESEVFSEEDFE